MAGPNAHLKVGEAELVYSRDAEGGLPTEERRPAAWQQSGPDGGALLAKGEQAWPDSGTPARAGAVLGVDRRSIGSRERLRHYYEGAPWRRLGLGPSLLIRIAVRTPSPWRSPASSLRSLNLRQSRPPKTRHLPGTWIGASGRDLSSRTSAFGAWVLSQGSHTGACLLPGVQT